MPVLEAAPALAYAAALPSVRTFSREPEQSIAIGQAAAPPLPELTRAEAMQDLMPAPREEARGCSNGAAYTQLREIGAFSAPGERVAAPDRFSALTAGDTGAWQRSCGPEAVASHATSYG